jgi:hypothetical protein
VSQITNKNWNRLKQKSRSFAGMIKLRWFFFFFFFFFAEQEKAPLCTGGAIPLRLAFPQKLLQKRWIALRHIDQCLPPISSG